MRLLFEGGDYSRAATIRGRRLFEGGVYLKKYGTSEGRNTLNGTDYSA